MQKYPKTLNLGTHNCSDIIEKQLLVESMFSLYRCQVAEKSEKGEFIFMQSEIICLTRVKLICKTPPKFCMKTTWTTSRQNKCITHFVSWTLWKNRTCRTV